MGKEFTSTYQPAKHTGPRMTTILEKFLATKLTSSDPEVIAALKATKIKSTKAMGLAMRYIYNGLEGETKAIEGIFDRIDGKVVQKTETELSGSVTMMPVVKMGRKPVEFKVGD